MKKKNENKEDVSFFGKLKILWKNKQYKAGIKLCFYLLFIAVICIFVSIYGNINLENNENEDTTITFGDMQNALVNSNYDYTYEVMLNKTKIIYEGSIEDKINTGYKKTISDVEEYYIDDTGIYSVNMGEKTLDDTIYEGVNTNYFNLEYVFKLIESISPLIEYHEEIVSYTYNINTVDEVSTIKIDTNQTLIESILIQTLNNEYYMNFDIISE